MREILLNETKLVLKYFPLAPFDTIDTIKKKLFAEYGILFYPNLLKFTETPDAIIVNTSNFLDFDYTFYLGDGFVSLTPEDYDFIVESNGTDANYIKKIGKLQETIKNQLNEELSELHEYIRPNIDSSFISTDDIVAEKFTVTFETNVDPEEIYHSFELRDEMPIIALKIDDALGISVTKSTRLRCIKGVDFKKWIMKKESFRDFRGCYLKYTTPELDCDIEISNSKVKVRCLASKSKDLNEQIVFIRKIINEYINVKTFDEKTGSVLYNVSTKSKIDLIKLSRKAKSILIDKYIFKLKPSLDEKTVELLVVYGKAQENEEDLKVISVVSNAYSVSSDIIRFNGIDTRDELMDLLSLVSVFANNCKGPDIIPKIKTAIRELNVAGVKCQKPRQPTLSKTNKGYEINGKKYLCNDNYPYIGFTNDNKPCCFKNEQTDKDLFIRNTTANERKFYTSKCKVDIGGYVTYVLKDKDLKFYIINKQNKIIEITGFDETGCEFYESLVPESRLIKTANKNCKHPPDFSIKRENMDSVCGERKLYYHPETGFPCCKGENEEFREIKFERKNVITSEKHLLERQYGNLPNDLNALFNDCQKNEKEGEAVDCDKYYRLGYNTENLYDNVDNTDIIVFKNDESGYFYLSAASKTKEENDKVIFVINVNEVVTKNNKIKFDKNDFQRIYNEILGKSEVITEHNYPYDKPMTLIEITSKINVIVQLENENGYIDYILNEGGALFPVLPSKTKLNGVPVTTLQLLYTRDKIPTIETLIYHYINSGLGISFRGYTVSKQNGNVSSFLTNYGIYIPVKPTFNPEGIKELLKSFHHQFQIIQKGKQGNLVIPAPSQKLLNSDTTTEIKYAIGISKAEKVKRIAKSNKVSDIYAAVVLLETKNKTKTKGKRREDEIELMNEMQIRQILHQPSIFQ